jgi:hypothetical protein
MRRTGMIGACAVLLSLAAVGAQPYQSGQFVVYGEGSKSCAKWLADRKDDGYPARYGTVWVMGWLSAAGFYRNTQGLQLRDTDTETVNRWIDGYCRAHPHEDLSDAAKALVNELTKH